MPGRRHLRQRSDNLCRLTHPNHDINHDSSEATTGVKPTLYLHPGQIVVPKEPTPVMTIVGSCVAVCLWDPAARAGGVAHYLLPLGPARGENPWRFGNLAIPELVQRILGAGGKQQRMRAKVFGGASVFSPATRSSKRLGESNVDMARGLLSGLGIPVVAEDVGGDRGRKLIFQADNGSAWVKLV